jgi:hypothetical protein
MGPILGTSQKIALPVIEALQNLSSAPIHLVSKKKALGTAD